MSNDVQLDPAKLTAAMRRARELRLALAVDQHAQRIVRVAVPARCPNVVWRRRAGAKPERDAANNRCRQCRCELPRGRAGRTCQDCRSVT